MSHPLQSRLETALDEGSKADKKVANFMIGALAQLPFETASSIAKKVKVSEATVGRFCRSIGYSSFRSLKEHLKHDIGDHPWLMRDRLRELQSLGTVADRDLTRGMELEINGLVSIYEMARTEQWQQVVTRLTHCTAVYVAGFQTERGMAQYFANQLQYIRDRVHLLDLSGAISPKCWPRKKKPAW